MALKLLDLDTGKEIAIDTTEIEQSTDFKEIYVTGIMGGGFGPYDMRMSFYDTKLETKKEKNNKKMVEKRLVKGAVIMPYAAAKQLYLWLGERLDEYEKNAGCEIYIGERELKKPTAEGGE